MNLDLRIKRLQQEIAELEAIQARGAITFDDWMKERRWPIDGAVIRVGAYGCDDIGGSVSYRSDCAPDHTFLPGERPVLMRGSYLTMTNGGQYENVQRYVSKVLSRYVCKWDKPTIFFKRQWRDYWRELSVRYMLKHGGGNSSMHPEITRPIRYMGRREPYFTEHFSEFVGDNLGLDAWKPSFMIRGKVFIVASDGGDDYVSKRVEMLSQFVKQSKKLEELDKRIAKIG